MAELSPSNRAQLSEISGNMMTLLLLDDAWTEFVRGPALPPDSDFPYGLPGHMRELLQQMGDVAKVIESLPERMGDGLQERFDALMWGDGLSTADRDDLRWLVIRAGGVNEMALSTARTLSDYEAEIRDLDAQVQRKQRGEPVAGDLSKKFRCGLGSGLLISGGAAIPAAGMAGAGAAVAVGGAVAAGVLVGATGGIGALGLIVVGLLVMRRQKC